MYSTWFARERVNWRDVFHVEFRPKDKNDYGWKGDAYIDAVAYQPVVVSTGMARKIPFAVRTFLGTSLPGLGFTVVYEPRPDGVWFPVSFGTEFKLHVLFFFSRQITINAQNRDSRRPTSPRRSWELQIPGIRRHKLKEFMVIKTVQIAAVLLISLSSIRMLVAQTNAAPAKNVVLVHGAWVDGSGWKPVYDILIRDGYSVSVVQAPLTSFADDVAAVRRVLAEQPGPCILVGHSYGGSLITEAGTDSHVSGLVYIAAHMPDTGENEAADGKKFPSALSKSTAIKTTPDGFNYLDPGQFMSTSPPICRRIRRPSRRALKS